MTTALWHVRCPLGGGIIPPIGLFEKIRLWHRQIFLILIYDVAEAVSDQHKGNDYAID